MPTCAAVKSRSATTVVCSLPSAFVQGIDISFGFDLAPSVVEGCTVTGIEGIVTHFARVLVRDNHVSNTELRAITMTEMSMGKIEDNEIDGAVGVGDLLWRLLALRDRGQRGRRRSPRPRLRRSDAAGSRDPLTLRGRGRAAAERHHTQPRAGSQRRRRQRSSANAWRGCS